MTRIHPAWCSILAGASVSWAIATTTTLISTITIIFFAAAALWLRNRLPRLAVQLAFGLMWSIPGIFLSPPLGPSPRYTVPRHPIQVCGTADSVSRRTVRGGVVTLGALKVDGMSIPGRLRLSSNDHLLLPSLGQRRCQRLRIHPVRPRFNPGSRSFEHVWLNRDIRLTAHLDPRSLSPRDVVERSLAPGTRLEWALPRAYVGRQLTDTRERYRRRIRGTALEHPAILEAMILGDSGALTPEMREQFRRTGTSHLFAISGLHVGLMAAVGFAISRYLICWLCPWWIRRYPADVPAAVGALGVAWMYVAIAGGPPSAQRAAWMITAWSLARIIAHRPDSVGALSLAFSIMLAGTPHTILDPSVQLSFGAVAAVLIGYRRGREWVDEATIGWPFRTVASAARFVGLSSWVSICCTLGSLPAALYHFDSFAPVGVILNVLAIPIAAYGLVIPGMLWLAWTMCSDTAGVFDSWLMQWVREGSEWLLNLTAYAASPPWTGEEASIAIVSLCGLITATNVLKRYRLSSMRSHTIAIACVCVAGCLVYGLHTPLVSTRETLNMTFLDVGHGDCVVIQRDRTHAILIDTGGDPTGIRAPGRRVVVPALRALGVESLDAVVLSHAHPDHYRGLLDVLQSVPIRQVWFNGQEPNDPSWRQLTERLEAAGIPLRVARGLLELPPHWDDVQIQVLARPSQTGFRSDWSENDNSLVIALRFRDFSALFTGDIERQAERFVLPHISEVDVLKVPHHGSATSSTQPFLERVRPQFAIAQAEDGGRYNLPNTAVESRYRRQKIPLWITGRCGAIRIETHGQTFEAHPYAPLSHLMTFCPL